MGQQFTMQAVSCKESVQVTLKCQFIPVPSGPFFLLKIALIDTGYLLKHKLGSGIGKNFFFI